ncbi:MAG: RlmF-related methyltransferase, partial [Promethearchaeota archaeon]
ELLFLYNQYIAQDLYDLKVEFSPAAIIPTPTMRYHFLKHVIQPIIKPTSTSFTPADSQTSTMIEVGTGASAIIALLAAKHFNQQVIATEIESDYLPIAHRNVNQNNLQDRITLIRSQGGLLHNVIPNGQKVDYIITNPPYYDKILSPKVIWGGKSRELVSGGEAGEEFILQLISESWEYLKPNGIIGFIIPKTRQATLIAVEHYLNSHEIEYEIVGLLVGNRTRYVFLVFNPLKEREHPVHELL